MASLYERQMKKNSALPADPPRVVLSSKPVPGKRRYVLPAPTKLHKQNCGGWVSGGYAAVLQVIG